jgi:hypothetical protein
MKSHISQAGNVDTENIGHCGSAADDGCGAAERDRGHQAGLMLFLAGRIDNYQCELKLNRVGRRVAKYDSLLSASSGGGYTGARTIGVQTN